MKLTKQQQRVLWCMQQYPRCTWTTYALARGAMVSPAVLAGLRRRGLLASEAGRGDYSLSPYWQRCTFWTLTAAGKEAQP